MTKQSSSRWAEGVMTALGLLWMALFPLWQDGSYSRITHSKWIGMLLLTLVTVIATGHLLGMMRSRHELRGQVRLQPVHAVMLVFFGVTALSALLGSYAGALNSEGQSAVLFGAKRFEGLLTQGCYVTIFLCMSLTRVNLRWLLTGMADALLVSCAVTALQYAGVNVLGLFPENTGILTHYEFQGLIGNIDMVTGYVSLAVPALMAGYVRQGRVLWLVSALGGVLLILCMQVQSGLIMLMAVLFLLVLLALRRPALRWRTGLLLGLILLLVSVRLLLGLPWLDGTAQLTFPHAASWLKLLPALVGAVLIALSAAVLRRCPGKALRRRWIALIAALVLLAGLALTAFAPIPPGNGLWELQEILHGRIQDSFGSERIGVWRLTLEMSREHLLLGTGPDTFLYAMDDYMARTGQSLTQHFDNPHNLFLAVLANNGLPAMLIFIGLLALALITALRRLGRDDRVLPLLLAVTGYLLQGMFTFSICLVTPMFYAMLGMLTAQCALPPTRKE